MSSNNSIGSNGGNDRGDQREILEDGPEYRSVMMMPPMAAPPMPRSFASIPPPSGLKFAPTSSTKKNSSVFSKSNVTLSTTRTMSWDVSKAVPIPPLYLLSRTNVYVKDTTPQQCADRIIECLRTLNIVAQPENDEEDEGSSVLRAETHDCVKFAVRLFSDQDAIVVEVQRTAGCAFGFREACKAVLRSAQGQSAPNVGSTNKKTFKIPPSLPPRSAEQQESCVREDFETACNMIRSTRLDSQSLGLESLEQMTKSSGSVHVAAKLVLEADCVQELVALLDVEEDATSHVSRKVLAILANALSGLPATDLSTVISSSTHLKATSFLSCLLLSLRESSERPHDAYQAVRCLKALLISEEIRDVIVQMNCIDDVASACNAGCNYHIALETEGQHLMSKLRDVCC